MDDDRREKARKSEQEDLVESVLKTGLAQLEVAAQQEYAPFGLPGNPFPFASVAIAETASLHPPLRKEQVEEIGRFLRTTISTGHFAGLRLVGDYGFGKTHILRWLENQINTAGHGRLLAVYVQNPGTTPREFVTRFTSAIGLEEIRKRIWVPLLNALRDEYSRVGDQLVTMLQNTSRSVQPGQQTLFSFDTYLVQAEIFDSRHKFLEVVRPQTEKLREFCTDVLSKRLGHYGMARALVDIAIASESSAFRAWTSITSVDTPKSNIISHEEQFRAVLKLLKETGVRRTYLLFDELEDITSARLSKRSQAEYAAVLKMLIDQNLDDFALVVAVTENGLNEMKSVYPPFVDRLTHTVALLPLSEGDATVMIARYLSEARKGTEYSPINPLFPFEDSGVRAIIRAGIRNPRGFLGFCHRLLAWACSEGVAVVDSVAVEAYLQQVGGR